MSEASVVVEAFVLGWLLNAGDPPTRGGLGGLYLMVVRRCPTLPHPPGCSTIGAVGLSFRVRNGTGRFPHAMTAVTLLPVPVFCLVWAFFGVGNLWWLQLWCCYLVVGSWNKRVVVREPHSGRVQCVVCGVSCWPISTGQLHESLVLASTSGLSTQWSGWGPLTHNVYGNLILKRASRLDAFSGYPIRT